MISGRCGPRKRFLGHFYKSNHHLIPARCWSNQEARLFPLRRRAERRRRAQLRDKERFTSERPAQERPAFVRHTAGSWSHVTRRCRRLAGRGYVRTEPRYDADARVCLEKPNRVCAEDRADMVVLARLSCLIYVSYVSLRLMCRVSTALVHRV
ncbi:hypothetical protein WMY93_019620 [Mugilogobius chulae]|uniref:Uncharacterized protein n=1 Tax=Mugilogobius chulae TaxID=88201 RepID=A0AAW0NPM3_9GOBI